MVINPATLSETLRYLTAQRLLRVPCGNCMELVQASAQDGMQQYLDQSDNLSGTDLVPQATRTGCEQCDKTGYTGRQVVAEIVHVDQSTAHLIHTSASRHEIEQHQRQHCGFRTMWDDAMRLIKEHKTTLEEAESVLKQ